MSGARRAFKGVGYQSNADIPPSMMMSRAVYIAQAISDPPWTARQPFTEPHGPDDGFRCPVKQIYFGLSFPEIPMTTPVVRVYESPEAGGDLHDLISRSGPPAVEPRRLHRSVLQWHPGHSATSHRTSLSAGSRPGRHRMPTACRFLACTGIKTGRSLLEEGRQSTRSVLMPNCLSEGVHPISVC